MTVGHEIATITNARSDSGISWVKVAENMGVTVQCVYRWRQAQTKVPLHRWQALARSIGVPLDDFCRDSYNRDFAKTKRNTPEAPEVPQEVIQPPTPPEPPQAASGGVFGWFGEVMEAD
ncbi:hypothetical protein JI58_02255 [Marinosulfonomonas sp. PRT-SC04]|nr:hypothetical protein JI58_02255 [Marinosulfonomonas sp. PRT-SC04]